MPTPKRRYSKAGLAANAILKLPLSPAFISSHQVYLQLPSFYSYDEMFLFFRVFPHENKLMEKVKLDDGNSHLGLSTMPHCHSTESVLDDQSDRWLLRSVACSPLDKCTTSYDCFLINARRKMAVELRQGGGRSQGICQQLFLEATTLFLAFKVASLQWCQEGGVKAHPQKFRFIENLGKHCAQRCLI